jgi:hypothetical protein
VIDFLLVALWGAVVLAAMDGWGGLAARLASNIPVDAGLRLAWGMAVLLAIGGVLTAFSLAAQPIVVIVVAAGALLAMPRCRTAGSLRFIGPMGCAAGLVLALHYLSQVAGVTAVCADDHLAYWGFVKRQLVLGSVDEPFSLRRLAGNGGQMFLQSLVVARGSLDNAFLIETGISPIIIYLLLRGALPGFSPVLPALTLIMTMATLLYEFNSQSECTGIVLFLGLARTLVALDEPLGSRAGNLILIGLLVAGLSSLRAHFLVGAALTAGVWLLSGYSGLRTLPALSWRAAVLCCASLGFFAAWMAGLWRSSGSILFPLFPGTAAGGYDTFSASSATFYDLALSFLIGPSGLLLCLPAMVLWRPAAERRVMATSLAVALLVMSLLSWRFSNSDVWAFERYLWPMVVVPVLLALIIVVRTARPQDAGSRARVALLASCFGVVAIRLGYVGWQIATTADGHAAMEEARLAERYRQLQDLVPVNETLLVATDNPYLIDYRRNRTWNIDLPGEASPLPGMPFYQGPEAVRSYLLAKGVHYVLFADGMQRNPCVFNRPRFTNPRMRTEAALTQLQGHNVLDFMDNMDGLAAATAVLGRQDHYTVLQLDGH